MTGNVSPAIQRGEIWNVNFDPQVGAEIGKVRPAVVMNVSTAGRLPLHIIVPITTGRVSFSQYFWMVPIPASSINGLDHDSFADAFQVKSVSVNRFVSKLGVVTRPQIDEIAAAVVLCIGYSPPQPKPTP
jgi:mRNA interferase MazF